MNLLDVIGFLLRGRDQRVAREEEEAELDEDEEEEEEDEEDEEAAEH